MRSPLIQNKILNINFVNETLCYELYVRFRVKYTNESALL